MTRNYNTSVELTDKARRELRSALYEEIGNHAEVFREEDLNKMGSFLLHALAISHKIKFRELKEKRALESRDE